MSIIYEPRGKAREYSPLAANFYTGCDHKCLYCYAPNILRKTKDDYTQVKPRDNIVELFLKDAKKNMDCKKQILFNFMGDPYCSANREHDITRQCLQAAYMFRLPIAILTKGGMRCTNDTDIFTQFGKHIKVGATLTFMDADKSAEWEAGAAPPESRIKALEYLKYKGIKTWASFEPVIEPEESLKLIEATLHYCDEYKIGKLNNYKGLDKKIDWTSFLSKVVEILRDAGKPFYIKEDLVKAAPSVKLNEEETRLDAHNVEPW